jgi:hypothetical protein
MAWTPVRFISLHRHAAQPEGARAPGARNLEERPQHIMIDPRSVDRLLGYMSKAVWLIMAYSFGTMVGRLILFAQHTS